VAGYAARIEESQYYRGNEKDERYLRSDVDRSDATLYYGGLFAKRRASSSVYGGLIDDPPLSASERIHERRRSTAAERGIRISRYAKPALPRITSAEKGIMVFVAVFISFILMGVIGLEAYSVSIQHGINKKNVETATIQKEIDELYVAIEQGSNIEAIEKKAKNNLKMRYPSSSQLKYGKDIKIKDVKADIAEDIRNEAYGA
jgi:cell division protein FtsL